MPELTESWESEPQRLEIGRMNLELSIERERNAKLRVDVAALEEALKRQKDSAQFALDIETDRRKRAEDHADDLAKWPPDAASIEMAREVATLHARAEAAERRVVALEQAVRQARRALRQGRQMRPGWYPTVAVNFDDFDKAMTVLAIDAGQEGGKGGS